MKSNLLLLLLILAVIHNLFGQDGDKSLLKSIRSFGVLPENSPEVNKANLQKAIDWASVSGAALFVEPTQDPYIIGSGIILRKNVSLIGVNGPVPRGTKHPTREQPVGSVLAIRDARSPFITVESATQIKGIAYPPTIQVSQISNTEGVTLMDLTFFGEYISMDFNAEPQHPCELILFQNCYGYPLGGEFIRLDYCYDIPRILHCHVNPAIQREIGRSYSRQLIDAVVAKQKFSYAINHTDNAQLIDLFTFGSFGGILLGPATYGQLTNFNFDCVSVGIHKYGDNSKNRNWMITQGSIIANTGVRIEDVHPFLIEGKGHCSISNVEAFSGGNGALTTFVNSWDYMTINGNDKCTISMFGCRMRDYKSDRPITLNNPNAILQAEGCIDKNELPFRFPENN